VNVGDAVKSKAALIEWLKQAVTEATVFCAEKGIDLEKIQTAAAQKFQRAKLLKDAENAIRASEESKRRYLALTGQVTKLFKAILPDTLANEFAPVCVLLQVLADQVRSQDPEVDISEALAAVEQLLDESIAAEGYIIRAAAETGTDHLIDLSPIDFDTLQAQFRKSWQHTQADKLQTAISQKLNRMVQLNQTRMDYKEHFEQMIAEYNAGSRNVEEHFAQLLAFAQSLSQEEQRGIAKNLSEEELAVFDLLTKPDLSLSKKEVADVKRVAQELLQALKLEKLVLDWRGKPQSRAAVRSCIDQMLDRLPPTYTTELYEQKCQQAYQHIYDSYFGSGRSVYVSAQ
jgi:type I restriction enzyme, R subunit